MLRILCCGLSVTVLGKHLILLGLAKYISFGYSLCVAIWFFMVIGYRIICLVTMSILNGFSCCLQTLKLNVAALNLARNIPHPLFEGFSQVQDALPVLKGATKSQKVGLCFRFCRTMRFCRVILYCNGPLLVIK